MCSPTGKFQLLRFEIRPCSNNGSKQMFYVLPIYVSLTVYCKMLVLKLICSDPTVKIGRISTDEY